MTTAVREQRQLRGLREEGSSRAGDMMRAAHVDEKDNRHYYDDLGFATTEENAASIRSSIYDFEEGYDEAMGTIGEYQDELSGVLTADEYVDQAWETAKQDYVTVNVRSSPNMVKTEGTGTYDQETGEGVKQEHTLTEGDVLYTYHLPKDVAVKFLELTGKSIGYDEEGNQFDNYAVSHYWGDYGEPSAFGESNVLNISNTGKTKQMKVHESLGAIQDSIKSTFSEQILPGIQEELGELQGTSDTLATAEATWEDEKTTVDTALADAKQDYLDQIASMKELFTGMKVT